MLKLIKHDKDSELQDEANLNLNYYELNIINSIKENNKTIQECISSMCKLSHTSKIIPTRNLFLFMLSYFKVLMENFEEVIPQTIRNVKKI